MSSNGIILQHLFSRTLPLKNNLMRSLVREITTNTDHFTLPPSCMRGGGGGEGNTKVIFLLGVALWLEKNASFHLLLTMGKYSLASNCLVRKIIYLDSNKQK